MYGACLRSQHQVQRDFYCLVAHIDWPRWHAVATQQKAEICECVVWLCFHDFSVLVSFKILCENWKCTYLSSDRCVCACLLQATCWHLCVLSPVHDGHTLLVLYAVAPLLSITLPAPLECYEVSPVALPSSPPSCELCSVWCWNDPFGDLCSYTWNWLSLIRVFSCVPVRKCWFTSDFSL